MWHYDESRRLTQEEWDGWGGCIVLVRGLRKLNENFSYERDLMEKHGIEFVIDGESCDCDEFYVEVVDGDGVEEIAKIIEGAG